MSVHSTHCCKNHGCKYGDEDNCTVMLGTEKQEYKCEMCILDEEGTLVRGGMVVLGDENTKLHFCLRNLVNAVDGILEGKPNDNSVVEIVVAMKNAHDLLDTLEGI